MKGSVGTMIGGMLTVLLGLVLLGVVSTQAASSGAAANIGSFSGVRSLNDLVPLLFIAGVLVAGCGMLIGGGYSAYKKAKGGGD